MSPVHMERFCGMSMIEKGMPPARNCRLPGQETAAAGWIAFELNSFSS
jgi:hypothetical protein